MGTDGDAYLVFGPTQCSTYHNSERGSPFFFSLSYLLEEPVVELHELGEADATVSVCVEARKTFFNLFNTQIWPTVSCLSFEVRDNRLCECALQADQCTLALNDFSLNNILTPSCCNKNRRVWKYIDRCVHMGGH